MDHDQLKQIAFDFIRFDAVSIGQPSREMRARYGHLEGAAAGFLLGVDIDRPTDEMVAVAQSFALDSILDAREALKSEFHRVMRERYNLAEDFDFDLMHEATVTAAAALGIHFAEVHEYLEAIAATAMAYYTDRHPST